MHYIWSWTRLIEVGHSLTMLHGAVVRFQYYMPCAFEGGSFSLVT